MKIKSVFLFVLLVCLCACPEKEKDYAQQVDPLIGTGGHGHTYPGAVVPHGLVQLSPDTRTNGWDACSGYHYDDQTLLGFSHTHLSGTGIGDLGDVVFLPYTGEEPSFVLPNGEDKERRYGSSFSHEKEKAAPGYYRVFLDNYAITAELTATTHAGFHRYTFPKSGNPGIYIDLTRTIHDRKLLDYEFTVVNEYEIQGMKHLSGWAPDRYVFFYARFSEPFTCSEANAQAFLKFPSTAEGKQILAKVGISFVDCPGAKNNLDTEIIDWNFDKIRSNARDVWNRELAKVEITTPDVKNRKIFYTALYHTALEPIVSSDVDGRFRTMDNRIAQDKDYQNYSVFSLWDTFRALHPLNTILSPAENQAMIRSLIRKSDEGGLLPMWELISNYTGCMIGYHAVPVIVDAYMKGQQDFDVTKAYLACQKASSYDTANVSPTIQRAILHKHLMPVGKYYKNTIGYIPADVEKQSVARGLEYAYDDWLIAQFAKALGKDEDCAKYMELSRNYKHYYDASTGFMRGKLSDGSWRTPFDARYSDHNNDDYCEGNAWQWTWFVPHDIEGLSELMGGRQRLIEKLDSLFTTSSEITGEHASADIAGLIGQYAHGNEPSHQTIHIYNVVGQAYKTQELVDKVLQTLYFDAPNGLSGNEDCGEMSAWYLLNSMGFYSYCPGIPYYSIGRPLFEKVKIHLQNGKTFLIRTTNNSAANKYIQSARLNGKELDVLFFSHQELMEGGLLEITMTDQPQKESKKL
ncbi:MAG: GH92 family glycosyl hydrolase [Dysgonamonadaceae bacterium]|jgi:predicted alpha-1,2-mannosidase|nr:GH92 family glycosyl hydrolase [Dysgonamonadaceae bacterium]